LLLLRSQNCLNNPLSPQTLSSITWSLARLGVRWPELSDSALLARVALLHNQHSRPTPQQASKLLWALGCLEPPPMLLQVASLEQLLTWSTSSSSQVLSLGESQALLGLARTGLQWHQLTVQTQQLVVSLLLRACCGGEQRQLATVLWAAGCLGLPVSCLGDLQRESLLRAVTDSLSQQQPDRGHADLDRDGGEDRPSWRLACELCGLARLGLRWGDLPAQLHSAIGMQVGRLRAVMNPLDVSSLASSLGELDAPLDSALPSVRALTISLLAATQLNLPAMTAEELARLLRGLSRAGVAWKSLSVVAHKALASALQKLAGRMTSNDLASSCHSMCVLTFDAYIPPNPTASLSFSRPQQQQQALDGDWQAFLSMQSGFQSLLTAVNLLSRTQKQLSVAEREQLAIFAQFLRVMKIVPDPSHIPSHLLRPHSTSSSAASSSSKLHDRVVGGLLAALTPNPSNPNPSFGWEVRTEASSFAGVFPVDIMVLQRPPPSSSMSSHDGDWEVVALLEVDGPSHYRCDGQLRRKDRLKEAMYLARHPESSFYRVRWDEEDQVGAEVLGEELAAELCARRQQCERRANPLVRVGEDLGQQLGNFMHWLLGPQ